MIDTPNHTLALTMRTTDDFSTTSTPDILIRRSVGTSPRLATRVPGGVRATQATMQDTGSVALFVAVDEASFGPLE